MELAEYVLQAHKIDESGRQVWGQFLDNTYERQIGIYGTAAAIRILSTTKHNKRELENSLSSLPGIDSESTMLVPTFDKDDLALTLKCTAILDAYTALRGSANSAVIPPVLNVILQSNIVNNSADDFTAKGGWGYFTHYKNVDYEKNSPSILPTAVVLQSMTALYQVMPASWIKNVELSIRAGTRWLLNQFNQLDTLTISSASWSIIALRSLESSKVLDDDKNLRLRCSSTATDLERHVVKTLSDSLPATPYSEPIFYSIPYVNKPAENHYVTFPVQALVGLALTSKQNCDRKTYVLMRSCSDYICDQVKEHRAPISGTTGRQSITDSLYALLFLIASCRIIEKREHGWKKSFYVITGVCSRAIAALALWLFAVACLYYTSNNYLDDKLGQAVLGVLSATLPVPAWEMSRVAWKYWRKK